MNIVWIGSFIALTLGVVTVFAATRRRASSIELGTMSNQWVAEKRSTEHSYHDR
jgi:hypothetical protein